MPISLEASPVDHKRSHRISREFGPAVAFSTVGGKGRDWFSAPKSIKYLARAVRLSGHSRHELSLWHSSHPSRDRTFSIWINKETWTQVGFAFSGICLCHTQKANCFPLILLNGIKQSWSNNLTKRKLHLNKEKYSVLRILGSIGKREMENFQH